MSAENAAAVERRYVSLLFGRIRPEWLAGYARAWKEWEDLPARLGAAIGKVTDVVLSTVDPAVMPEGVDPEVFQVQVFNVIREAEGGPLARARQLLAAEPPRRKDSPGWRFGMLGVDHKDVWHRVYAGLVHGPIWDLIVPAWQALTPDVRAAIARSVGEPPAELRTAEEFAWLEWAASRPRPHFWQSIAAMRGLTADEGERLATLAVGQHEAWAARGLFRRDDHQKPKDVAWELLGPLRFYLGGYSAELDARIARAGVRIHPSTFRSDEQNDDEPYFRQGFALLAPSEVDEVSPAVRAGHGEEIMVDGFSESLLVLLDLDLTCPELAFLGLKGTRLLICDWAAHTGRLCYTRVGLDGEVSLMRKKKKSDEDDLLDEEEEGLVLGPAFSSPIPDMPGLGWRRYDARIGGTPDWQQEPEWPKSPDDRRPMTFLAQFPHPNGGTAYAFLDPVNLIATVRTQWD